MKTRLILALVTILAHPAVAGVDGGNPTRQPVYNMVHDYRVTALGLVAAPTGVDGGIRLEGPLTYRDVGHFVIASHAPALGQGESVCGKRTVADTDATIFWIGRDCAHTYFMHKFGELVAGVHKLGFSK